MVSQQIQIPLFGIRTAIDPGSPVDHPQAPSTYVFEYFEAENVCILYPSDQGKSHRTTGNSMRTWFHLKGDGLEPCLKRYAIPIRQALTVAIEPSALIDFLEQARRHIVQREPYWEDAVTILCQTFFRNLSRSISHGIPDDRPSLYQRENLATLRRVRAEIHANLDRRWTIDEMAGLANLSSSYYRNVFTRFFGVSPIEDLTRARIRRAKLLLRSSKLSVKEIAEQSGFSNPSQFYVYFRERTGHSPGDLIKAERNTTTTSGYRAKLHDRESIDDVSLLYLEPVGCWRFDAEDGGADQDYHFRHGKLQFSHGATGGPGLYDGSALILQGNHAHAEIAEPIVNTEESYTVSAWVYAEVPTVPTDWMTAVSISNEHHCSFYLQYCLSEGCFMFTVSPSGTDFHVIHVRGVLKPQTGKWFHLAGVHDAERRKIMLYENGVLSGTLPYDTPWRATGPTRFGASVYWGALTDLWYGRIAEIRFYNRALPELEISTIYHHAKAK